MGKVTHCFVAECSEMGWEPRADPVPVWVGKRGEGAHKEET